MSDTIAAIATGNSVSAIGIVRVSGGSAIDIVSGIFTAASGIPLEKYPDKTLVYGDLRDTNDIIIDKCMCAISRAPNSYTGENTAELHCHGSPTILRLALESLFGKGARQALPGEFTKRAFLNGKLDLTQAEAVIDLIESETEEIAKNAAGQLGGAIQRKTNKVYDKLVDIISHYHAVLDYPDEDIEAFELLHYKDVFENARKSLLDLAATFERGRVMKNGVRTVILGRPNVGKSTLLNALLGYERAIVTPIPGTTRDTIEESVIVGGVRLRLIDTAGLRDSEDEVEQIGIDRARLAAQGADLALALYESESIYMPENYEVLEAAESARSIIHVATKIDIPKPSGEYHFVLNEFRRPAAYVALSALTGEGMDKLEMAISELYPNKNTSQGEIITNSRQYDAILRAYEHLDAVQGSIGQGSTPDIVLTETESALSALGELTGKTVREDVTDRIFERFCVGK